MLLGLMHKNPQAQMISSSCLSSLRSEINDNEVRNTKMDHAALSRSSKSKCQSGCEDRRSDNRLALIISIARGIS